MRPNTKFYCVGRARTKIYSQGEEVLLHGEEVLLLEEEVLLHWEGQDQDVLQDQVLLYEGNVKLLL